MARVLAVDDLPENLRLLSRYLARADHDVLTASSGTEAIRTALKLQPDVILLDVMMPGIDGIETCRRLKEDDRTRAIPVILVTALDRDTDVVAGLDAGADDYVTKPYSPDILLARTNAAIHRHKMIRENESLLEEVRLAATTDSLTGLLNRRTFFDHFRSELSRASRHRLRLSCVILDIDFFKKVNDEHGHAAGDTVLVTIAEMLKDACRKSDYVCRYGGEEFCVLLPHTLERDAVSWANRVRERIAKTAVPVGDALLSLSASFGVTGRLDDVDTPDAMIDLADQALGVAKRSGRNCVIPYSAIDETMALRSFAGNEGDMPYLDVAARDVMTTPVFCLPHDAPLRRAAVALLQMQINAVPVVDDAGSLVGIISERDLIEVAVNDEGWTLPISSAMTKKVVQFQEDTPALSIHEFLCRNGIRRVLVVDQDGRPTGVISRANLLRRLRNWEWVNSGNVSPLDGPERDDFQYKLSATTGDLADQLLDLQCIVRDDESDFGAPVIDSVSKVQELCEHLLSHARAAVTRRTPDPQAAEPWFG